MINSRIEFLNSLRAAGARAEQVAFLPEFLEVTREKYGTELARLDFAQTDNPRKTINRWLQIRRRARSRI